MTNEEIYQRGVLINDETEPAQNTSERVGGVIKGIGQNLADKDTAITAQAARNGYYQCTVNSNQLAVTAPGFTLPAHGGNIRIKMSAPATGACTLNINSTGPKTLLYNGAAVSSANTWEQNEIISVFYDPSGSGQYLASNSQGGGGKAEKIKYDNSQSGLAAENVQGALDDIKDSVYDKNKIGIKAGLSTQYYYTYNNGVIGKGSSTVYRCWEPIDVSDLYAVAIKFYLSPTSSARTFFTDENDIMVGNFLSNVSGNYLTYIVPEGAKKLYWCANYSQQNDVGIYGVCSQAKNVMYDNSTVILSSENIQDALNEIGNTVFELNQERIAAGASTQHYYTYNNGTITKVSDKNYRCWNPIDVSQYYAVSIKFFLYKGADAKTFFTDENDIMVGDFLFNTSGDNLTYIVPEGAKKLYWSVNYSQQNDVAIYKVMRDTAIDAERTRYNNLSSIISANNVQSALDELGKAVFELNQTRIAAGASTQHYYTYNNGVITKVSAAANSYRCFEPIDITPYYALSIKFNLSDSFAKTFFTNENDIMVGDFLTNVTGDYVNYVIPQGAKKLYWTINYGVQTDIAICGLTRTKKEKEISILFIGNSLTQDAVSYAPLLLRELAPEVDFKFYMWYNGGYNLADHLNAFNTNDPCDIFSVCESSPRWTNTNNSVTMQSILSTYKFDIVCLQEYFNYQESANLEAFNGIIEYIENHYSHPFKVVTLFHQPKRDVAATVFSRTKTGNALLLKETVAEDMISSGIAIYRALSTSLDSLGDQGHLSPDGTHAQEGLPCMMQAYVTAMWVMEQVGIPMSVNNAASVVDNSNYSSINVPGPNLGTGVVVGTTEQVRLSQKVAIKAFKEGEYIVNANLTEYT